MKDVKDILITPMNGSVGGTGKSMLDAILKLRGIKFVAGPVHTDGPDDYVEAERAAHSIEDCLPNLHDTVLDATGQSLADAELRELQSALPAEIKKIVKDYGLADTEVREEIFTYLRTKNR
jgi:hypothetical protein